MKTWLKEHIESNIDSFLRVVSCDLGKGKPFFDSKVRYFVNENDIKQAEWYVSKTTDADRETEELCLYRKEGPVHASQSALVNGVHELVLEELSNLYFQEEINELYGDENNSVEIVRDEATGNVSIIGAIVDGEHLETMRRVVLSRGYTQEEFTKATFVMIRDVLIVEHISFKSDGCPIL